ncbi:MAG: oxidoreductase [Alteromonadaceae bacterium]|uniref:GMC family oxidoreductase n=1 Tax=uncultured Paraglaciecola sp. TaxID=1765024 RepID=UPI000C5895B6|nr:oxidoreductase [Alteromonadaceae bacterium]|tara:strand:+ start:17334 stop:19010 length:1677 start_codon:yes stop_codon:yes gene_type:complete
MVNIAKHYDAIVVGSGASGSFAAMELTKQGLNVLLLEAGKDITPDDFPTDSKGPKEKGIQLWARARATLTGQPQQAKVAFYGQQQRHLFVNDFEHPYSTPKSSPFLFIRGKQLGGRLHTFGRMLLRWSDADFKAADNDGYGESWPISYADIAPYYDEIETFLGVRGNEDHVSAVPDGKYVGPSYLTQSEKDFKQSIETNWNDRKAIAWRYMPPNIKRIPQPILAAKETGNLTIRTDAVVRQVLTDKESGKASGVEFVDRHTKESHQISASLIMLCASPIESTRLLMNSVSSKHPKGLGNSSNQLGKYFMDQVPSILMGTVSGKTGFEIDDSPLDPDPFYGRSGGVYIPRFENINGNKTNDFIRGYAFQGTVGRLFVQPGKATRYAFMGFGEMLPHADNTIALHSTKKDRWGVPIPHVTCDMKQNEKAMLTHQTTAMKSMAKAAGLDIEFSGSYTGLEEQGTGAFPEADWFSRMLFRKTLTKSLCMGAAIHESGGARMGSDPESSVLNQFNQCWDSPNVFVTDASSFRTGGSAGTTLTVMALTIRASRYAAEQLKAGTL